MATALIFSDIPYLNEVLAQLIDDIEGESEAGTKSKDDKPHEVGADLTMVETIYLRIDLNKQFALHEHLIHDFK